MVEANVQSLVPLLSVPSPDGAAQPAIDDAIRGRIKDYFDVHHEKRIAALRALRFATRLRKFLLGGLGGIVLAGSIAAYVAGEVRLPWLHGWEPVQIAAGAVGLIALIVAILLKTGEELPDRKQVETEIDTATNHDINALQAAASKLLRRSGSPSESFDVMLIGYPDKKTCVDLGVTPGARVGLDTKPRLTPISVTAMKLWPSSLAIYKGTANLLTGDMVEERLLEVIYRDIVILERSSQARPSVQDAKKDKKARKTNKRRPMHEKDVLAIHFANDKSVEVILRDTQFADPLREAELPLSASHEEIKRFWDGLRSKWYAAQDRGA